MWPRYILDRLQIKTIFSFECCARSTFPTFKCLAWLEFSNIKPFYFIQHSNVWMMTLLLFHHSNVCLQTFLLYSTFKCLAGDLPTLFSIQMFVSRFFYFIKHSNVRLGQLFRHSNVYPRSFYFIHVFFTRSLQSKKECPLCFKLQR